MNTTTNCANPPTMSGINSTAPAIILLSIILTPILSIKDLACHLCQSDARLTKVSGLNIGISGPWVLCNRFLRYGLHLIIREVTQTMSYPVDSVEQCRHLIKLPLNGLLSRTEGTVVPAAVGLTPPSRAARSAVRRVPTRPAVRRPSRWPPARRGRSARSRSRLSPRQRRLRAGRGRARG